MLTLESSLQILPGGITLDGRTGEVRKDGSKINLPDQLFRLLALLGSRADELVTREEIRQSLWADSFVNFDDSINTAIRRLRQYLGGIAGSTATIETVPGRGYRFLSRNALPMNPAPRNPNSDVDRPRLVVLPFENLSRDPHEDYLAGSFTDGLITSLAKNPAICVKLRSLLTGSKQLRVGFAAIGRKLKVDAVLQGSIVQIEGRLRVTAQLMSVATEEYLWADSYTCDSGDVLDFESEIADRVSAQVAAKLAPAWKRHSPYVPPMPFAHNAHLKAQHTFHTFTNEGFWKARRYWTEAIRKDPSYAQALAGLAESYNMLGITGLMNATDALGEAQLAAKKAVEIDESLAEAHAALAHTYTVQWNWEAAAGEFKRALELDPYFTSGNPCHYVEFLMATGPAEEAIRETERLWAARPLANFLGTILGWAYYGGRSYDRALEQHQEMLKDDPKFGLTHVLLGLDYSQKKRYRTAIKHCAKVNSNGGTRLALNALGYIYATAGDKQSAKEILNELKRLLRTAHASSYASAAIYAGMGETQAAFDFLNRACEVRDPELMWMIWDPQLDKIRSDPRFEILLSQMGLPASRIRSRYATV